MMMRPGSAVKLVALMQQRAYRRVPGAQFQETIVYAADVLALAVSLTRRQCPSLRHRQVKEAIPVPLMGLQAFVAAARASPFRPALFANELILQRCCWCSLSPYQNLSSETVTCILPRETSVC